LRWQGRGECRSDDVKSEFQVAVAANRCVGGIAAAAIIRMKAGLFRQISAETSFIEANRLLHAKRGW